jgi:hypothetical protein
MEHSDMLGFRVTVTGKLTISYINTSPGMLAV